MTILEEKVELKLLEESIQISITPDEKVVLGLNPVILFSQNTFQSLYDTNDNQIVDRSENIERVYICGETISGGIPVCLIDGKIYRAKASQYSHFGRVIGVSKQAGVQNDAIEVVLQGEVAANVSKGNRYWLASDGGLTNSVPNSGIAQLIGICEEDRKLLVSIEQPIWRSNG